jgi:Mg/Co/Ni transporter MgtE
MSNARALADRQPGHRAGIARRSSLFGGRDRTRFALAVLMPIVAGMGGNAGTQTLAVVVRALATNQLTDSNTWRMIGRELRVAMLNGATLGHADRLRHRA